MALYTTPVSKAIDGIFYERGATEYRASERPMTLSLDGAPINDCHDLKRGCLWLLCCPCMATSSYLKYFKSQQEEKQLLEGLEWINGVVDDLTVIWEEEREAAGGFNENESMGWLVEMIKKARAL